MGMHQDFVQSYMEAWNQHDSSQVANHLCPGGLYCDMTRQERLSDKALIQYLNDYFDQDYFRYELVGDVLVGANTIAFQYRAEAIGEQDGPISWEGAEFIELAGDTAVKISDYYRPFEPASPIQRPGRYAKSGLSDEAMQHLIAQLTIAMEEQQLFLDPDLSLPKLAEHLDCSVNHLSQAINAGHSMSFFDYINHYRVQEAARMLQDKSNHNPAILTVALSVGFNSTSTFYTAFKKATGKTPARYRRSFCQ